MLQHIATHYSSISYEKSMHTILCMYVHFTRDPMYMHFNPTLTLQRIHAMYTYTIHTFRLMDTYITHIAYVCYTFDVYTFHRTIQHMYARYTRIIHPLNSMYTRITQNTCVTQIHTYICIYIYMYVRINILYI